MTVNGKTLSIEPGAAKGPAAFALLPISWITLGHAVVDIYMNLLPPLLHLFAVSLGLQRTELGIVIGVLSITGNAMQPVFGFLVDRWKKKWLLPVSLLVSGVFAASVGFANTLSMLVVAAVFIGLGSALYHPLGSVAVHQLGADKKGLAVSLYSNGGQLGYALTPFFTVVLVRGLGFSALAYVLLPALLVALPLYRQSGSISLERPVPGRVNFITELGSQWRPLLTLNLIAFLRSWVQLAVLTLLPWYAMELGFSQWQGGNMIGFFSTSGVLGGFIGGYLSDRLGRRPVIMGSLLGGAASLLCLLWAPSNLLLWTGLLLTGACLHAMVPSSIVMAQEMLPSNAGMASGMMMGLSFGLGGIGVTLTTYLSDILGVVPALASVIPLLLVAALGSILIRE